MSVYQLIYTSSKRGYGVFSKSTEIKPDESRQITINTTYKRPQSLIDSNENDLSKFPVNLARFRLSNQKWVIAHTSYVGADNTGRQGNFFTHALLFGNPGDFNKKFLYFSYRDHLTDEEKELSNPAPLSPLDGELIPYEPNLTFAKSNQAKLVELVQSFLNAQQGRKKLAIQDNNKNIIQWIKALYELIPVKLMEDIEFTTYTDRITSAFDIIGIYDPSIIKDSSRFVIFDVKSSNIETTAFAKSIVDDYVNSSPKELFYFFASTMKKEELLTKIDSLYSTLNANEVNVNEVFTLINNLPKKDPVIASEVVSFLLASDFLMKFDNKQIQYILGLIEPAQSSQEYFDLIYKLTYQCKNDTLNVIVNQVQYARPLFGYLMNQDRNDNINFLLLSMRVKSEIHPFRKERFEESFELVESISSSKRDLIQTPLNHLIDQLIMTFPRNDGTHSDSDLKSILRKLKNLVDVSVVNDRIQHRLRNEMQQMDQVNALAVRNCMLMLALNNDSKELVRILRAYDSKEDQPKLLQILDIAYNTLGESLADDNSLMSQYKLLFPIFEQAFDHLSHRKQKQFVRRYRRVFGNRASLRFRTNYTLFGGIAAVVFILVGSLGFLLLNQRPYLESIVDSGIQHRAFIGAKVINEDNPIIIFENTPEGISASIAREYLSGYSLSSQASPTYTASINTNQNRIEFRIVNGGFLSPVFAVQYRVRSIEQPPIISFTNIPDPDDNFYQLEANFMDIYDGEVSEILNRLLGDVIISDSTLEYYRSISAFSGLGVLSPSFNIFDPDQIDSRFISVNITDLEKFNESRKSPLVNEHSFVIDITNHMNRSQIINVLINMDNSVIELPDEMIAYNNNFPFSFLRLLTPNPYRDITQAYLRNYDINLNQLSFEEYRYELASGIYRFNIVDNDIQFNVPLKILEASTPEISLMDHSGVLEIAWRDLIDDNFENLKEEILIALGSINISDPTLKQFFADPLYLSLKEDLGDLDFSLLALADVEENEFYSLIFPTEEEMRVLQGESSPLRISIKNVFDEISNEVDITLVDSTINQENESDLANPVPDEEVAAEEATDPEDNESVENDSDETSTSA
jgi:hypothetical protein